MAGGTVIFSMSGVKFKTDYRIENPDWCGDRLYEMQTYAEKSAKMYQYIPFSQYIGLCKNTDYDFLIEVNDKGFL